MKKIFILSISILSCAIVFGQLKADEVIKMNKETHDFGKVKQSMPVRYVFEIKNISGNPIVISNAYASCGCVVPEKPEQPIEPGKTAPLKVQFNAPAVGRFQKVVYIEIAGNVAPKEVYITGEVLTAEAYEEWQKAKAKGQ